MGPLKPPDTSGRGGGEGMMGGEEGRAVFSLLNVQVCAGTVHTGQEEKHEGGRRCFPLYVHSLWMDNSGAEVTEAFLCALFVCSLNSAPWQTDPVSGGCRYLLDGTRSLLVLRLRASKHFE